MQSKPTLDRHKPSTEHIPLRMASHVRSSLSSIGVIQVEPCSNRWVIYSLLSYVPGLPCSNRVQY